MTDATDLQLLRTCAECRSEAAFAELLRRHVDFVYSAATCYGIFLSGSLSMATYTCK